MSTTQEVMILTPGNGAEYRQVEVGTTVGSLVDTLVSEGRITDADRVSILDGSSQALGNDSVITEETSALNFIVKLAGA
jgi:hypothetical protein